MNELIKLWVSVTKRKEIEEFESDVQKLYDYTMNLQKENEQLKEDIKDVDIWNKLYNEQFDKNRKLEENWNKLKEYIKQEPTLDFYNDKLPFEVIMVKIINKMQELEGSDSNE